MEMRLKIISIICLGHLLILLGCNNTTINAPSIYSFYPLKTSVDKYDTITGINFSPIAEKNYVAINGYQCPIVSATTSQIVIKTIPGVSSGSITVTVDQLAAVSHKDFTLVPHHLDSIVPRTEVPGGQLMFYGKYFCDAPDSVNVNFRRKNDRIVRASISNYTKANDSIFTFSAIVPDSAVTGKISIRIGKVLVTDTADFVLKLK